MNIQFTIAKLTELLIKQDLKDKQLGKKELISKVGAYRSLINFFKNQEQNCQDEYTLTPDENGTTQINGVWFRVDKK